MSCRITYELKKDYLHARVEGENTVENIQKYLQEVSNTCKVKNCTKILIEENLSGLSIGTLEIFRIVDRASQDSLPVLHKIAYVDMNPEHDFKGMQFAETVARNRGVYVRLFRDVKSAEAWLEDKSDN